MGSRHLCLLFGMQLRSLILCSLDTRLVPSNLAAGVCIKPFSDDFLTMEVKSSASLLLNLGRRFLILQEDGMSPFVELRRWELTLQQNVMCESLKQIDVLLFLLLVLVRGRGR